MQSANELQTWIAQLDRRMYADRCWTDHRHCRYTTIGLIDRPC